MFAGLYIEERKVRWVHGLDECYFFKTYTVYVATSREIFQSNVLTMLAFIYVGVIGLRKVDESGVIIRFVFHANNNIFVVIVMVSVSSGTWGPPGGGLEIKLSLVCHLMSKQWVALQWRNYVDHGHLLVKNNNYYTISFFFWNMHIHNDVNR